jgi:hypothetical protein
MRAISWEYVFIASSFWIAINFIFVTFFYKEPTEESTSANPRSLKKVFSDMVEVLGNARFFVLVFGLLVILVLGSKFTSTEVITWTEITIISFAWIAINFIYDLILRKNNSQNRSWFTSPMKLADWRFALFLLLMSGFWTAFNQIFYTLPLYIRDFTDTSDLFFFLQSTLEGIGLDSWAASLNAGMVTENQLNPEYIININAGGIVLFQVIVSYFVTRFYWAVALGNLFGGILSGQLYAAFARDMQRPDIMWAIFAALAALTALLVFLYDKFVIRRSS